MGREVVRELVQGELTEKHLTAELGRLLAEGPYRTRMQDAFNALRERLGGPGASRTVAIAVWKSLTEARPTARS
ncbi:MAG: lipid-A-disaccharide synthase, partial [Flavobacteriales bacterium]|jgi:lipid A disaccharide synthetase|nr:lipid-A-disaccharide synthase [Flavobacteriales bacterium]